MKNAIVILFALTCISIYSFDEFGVNNEIPDPFGRYSKYDYEKFLDERNYSIEEENEYFLFHQSMFSGLEVVNEAEEVQKLEGLWVPENNYKTDSFFYFDFYLQRVEIFMPADDDKLILGLFGPVGAWGIYHYGDYYLSSMANMGSIVPPLLLNFIDGKCYFYTLEGSTWKLLPYHREGGVYLKKVLPNS